MHSREKQLDNIKSWLGTGSINFFGLPFSGKDTQGKHLADLLGAPLIGGGDVIRNSNRQELKQAIAGGKLAPQDEFLALLTPYLSQPEFKDHPLVLSSVGRWHGEERVIMKAVAESGHPIKAIIVLDMPESEVIKRWEKSRETKDRGERDDDAHEAIETRFEEFRNKTKPVIDFYRDLGLLIEVDGTGSREEVFQEILDKLSLGPKLAN